jgi:hypothetical protein
MRFVLLALFVVPSLMQAQKAAFPMQTLSLDDLSAFRPAAKNWRIAGDVAADLGKDEALQATPGKGVLANLPDSKQHDHLVTVMEHGDLDLEVDVLLARHSNSGIYLQGRYEIQILDSWGKVRPKFGDMAGIYQRWDDSKPEGQQGFEGNAPRLNAAKAPGLWQRLRVEFQAPRFDASGRKIANARIVRVLLNGVLVHENLELTGPTRGPMAPNEVAKGPLLIQGDHGPVAFRNFRYRSYDGTPAALRDIRYESCSWDQKGFPNFLTQKMDKSGELTGLTWEVTSSNTDFATRYRATLRVPKSGRYHFDFQVAGTGLLKIGNDTLYRPGVWGQSATRTLEAGDLPLELQYAKNEYWYQPMLALFVEGDDFRATALHLASSATLDDPIAPIFVEPRGRQPELLRSFIDIRPDTSSRSVRLVHPISVGYPDGPAYTFDLDRGTLVQVWRGGFLDATPMWENRGDGHAEPRGSVTLLGLAPQVSSGAFADTLAPDANYRFGGYRLDADGSPTFEYIAHGTRVSDKIRPASEGKTLSRELSAEGSTTLLHRLAVADRISVAGPNLWLVGDKNYFISAAAGQKIQLRNTADGRQELVATLGRDALRYEVVW